MLDDPRGASDDEPMKALPLLLALVAAPGLAGQDPEPEALDVEAVRGRLQAELETLVGERGLPGASAAIVLPDGTVVAAAAGFASREDERALTPADRLLSGSVGKSYVAATALELVLDGRLELDAAVADFFEGVDWYPRLPNGGAFTVRQLLRHETGMDRYEMGAPFWEAALGAPDRTWRPEELLEFVLDADPLFRAGEGWGYADTNYILLGMVLEQVLERPITEHVHERFLVPNGLADTVPSNARSIPGLVQGYAVSTRALGLPERVIGDDGLFVFNPQFEWCGGGYANTPTDLARWARLFYGGRLFEEPYLELLLDTKRAPGLGPGKAYGMGVIVSETELGPLHGHDGFMTGYLTCMGVFAEHDLAVAFQTNTDDVRAVGAPLHVVLTRLAKLAVPG